MELALGLTMSKADREHYSRIIIFAMARSGEQLRQKITGIVNTKSIEFDHFLNVAQRNKVLLRSLLKLKRAELFTEYQETVDRVLYVETRRLVSRLGVIRAIHESFEDAGIRFLVMKTLDNLPDMGNDIDLLVHPADAEHATTILRRKFQGANEPAAASDDFEHRSICDRLVGKNLFYLGNHAWETNDYGPPQAEVYPRFCQLGEEYLSAERLISRKVSLRYDGFDYYVPCDEHRLLLTAIHSLFRHGVIRISELHNSMNWIEKGVDWDFTWREAESSGILYALSYFLRHVAKYSSLVSASHGLSTLADVHFTFTYPLKPANSQIALFWSTKGLMDIGHLRLRSAARSLLLAPILAGAALAKFRLTGRTGIW